MWCLSITDKAGYFKIWHEEDYDFYKAVTFRCGRKRSLLEVQNLYFMFIIALHSQNKTIHSIYKYQ